MLNLAAIRYRRVVASQGGPIARLESSDVAVLGRRQFVANAYLAPGLGDDTPGQVVFGSAHGSGTADSPMLAKFMAISEAMERWAHWQLHASAAGRRYGFEADPSSNGMAAFPGMFARQARDLARMEAAERFNLMHWWEGQLTACEIASPWPGVRVATIGSEAPGVTVIAFRRDETGSVAYGHAAAPNLRAAIWRAAIEMERHAEAVRRYFAVHIAGVRERMASEVSAIEGRSLFFASPEGHELFLARLCRSAATRFATPRLVFDGAVPGPWMRYADVWRVVYAPPSDRFLADGENYFLW